MATQYGRGKEAQGWRGPDVVGMGLRVVAEPIGIMGTGSNMFRCGPAHSSGVVDSCFQVPLFTGGSLVLGAGYSDLS